jgi:hypothetical protein
MARLVRVCSTPAPLCPAESLTEWPIPTGGPELDLFHLSPGDLLKGNHKAETIVTI